MRALVRLGGALVLCWMTAGCQTTGDPTQGGLFGWSESKARERQNERQARVAGAETELSSEESQQRALQARSQGAEHQIAAAQSANQRAERGLRAQQAALVAKTGELERESPTPASASRARSWRLKINTIAAQTALSIADRSARLRAIEAEIDTALGKAKR
ncbi:MAG TPA: hypothetical protein VGM54_10850 [Chthoniobacter sp.]|jgi:hypothetical protein